MSLRLVTLPDFDVKQIFTFACGVGLKLPCSNGDFCLQMK